MSSTQLARSAVVTGLDIGVRSDAKGTVVTLRGEADAFTLPLLIDRLAMVVGSTEGPLVVDLSEARFIDMGNVRALARTSRFLNDQGRSLTLRSPSSSAARVLQLLGVGSLVEANPAAP